MSTVGGQSEATKLHEYCFRAGLIEGADIVAARAIEHVNDFINVPKKTKQAFEWALFQIVTRIKCRGIVGEMPVLHKVEEQPQSPPEVGGTPSSGKRRRATSSRKGAV